MFRMSSRGDYSKTINALKRAQSQPSYSALESFGRRGVEALSRATPVDTGKTASSWAYRIIKDPRRPGIEWYNTNVKDGTSIAILIQSGHGTGTGGYVQGRDYINPAMRPVFEKIESDFMKEVSSWQG
jgi:hypothetical protein